MTSYRCLVLAPSGKTDWRTVDAPDESAAVALLVAEGVTPLDVRSGGVTLIERLNQPVQLRGGLGVAEQSLILTQLATLVRSGLPLDRSLDLLRDQATRAGQRQALARAVTQVRGGERLATAFESLGFPGYVVGVLRAAERGGGLGDALASVAERMTLAAQTRTQLISALSYPVAVLGATLLALALVLLLVVPQFAPIFEGEEKRLPALTRFVLTLSALVQSHGLLLVAAAGALPVAVLAAIRSEAIVPAHVRRRLPGFRLRDDYLSAQFAGVLGTLIANGVSAVAALPLARAATGSRRWQAHLGDVEREVREGSRLSAALARAALLPITAVRLVEVGERTGSLANSCLQASAIISRSAKARIDRIVALANPIAIMLLGGLVGALVGGVMLGIFALGDFTG